MKRLVVVLGSLALLVLGLMSFGRLARGPFPASFKVNEAASFYVIYADKLASYQFQDGQATHLETQELPVMDYHSYQNYEASFDQTSLMFGSRPTKSFAGTLYRLDFKKGRVTAVKTSQLSDQTGGQTDNYFLSYSGDQLTAFDQDLSVTKSITLPDLMPNLTMPAKEGQIYVVGQEFYSGPGQGKNHLVQIDEATMTVTKEMPLETGENVVEQLRDSAILDQHLYLTIPFRGTDEPSFDLKRINLDTEQVDHLALSWPYPMRFHATTSQGFLFVEHSSYDLERLVLTVLDGGSDQQLVIDLTDHINQSPKEASVSSLAVVDDRYALITVANQLFVYDLDSQQVVNHLELEEDFICGIFVAK